MACHKARCWARCCSLYSSMIYLVFFVLVMCIYNADDTVIYYSDKNVNVIESVLNTELQALDKWMSLNKLLVNYNKTVSMLHGTRHMLSKCDALNLNIRDIRIDKVKKYTIHRNQYR